MSLNYLLLAIAPGLAICLYVYHKDKYQPEPLWLLVKCFFMGALATIPAFYLEKWGGSRGFGVDGGGWNTFIYAYFVVALAEEGSKYFMLWRYAYRNPHFDEPFDGIVYTVMVGMGFATLENILYVADGGLNTAIMRMITAVPAHATFAVIMGYFLGKAKFSTNDRLRYKLYAIGGAMVFHGTYDYSLFELKDYPLASLGALASLIIGIRLSRNAIAKSSEQSKAFNNW